MCAGLPGRHGATSLAWRRTRGVLYADAVGGDSLEIGCSTVGEGISCQVKSAVVNFAAGNFAAAPGICGVNFAHTPRNVVVPRALQACWSLATGASFAEDPGFCVGNFVANLECEISHKKLTAPEIPPPPLCKGTVLRDSTHDRTERQHKVTTAKHGKLQQHMTRLRQESWRQPFR